MLIVFGLLKAGLILTVGLITIDDWKFVTTITGFHLHVLALPSC